MARPRRPIVLCVQNLDPHLNEGAIAYRRAYPLTLVRDVDEVNATVVGCPRREGAVHCRTKVEARHKAKEVLTELWEELVAHLLIPCPVDAAPKAPPAGGVRWEGPKVAEIRVHIGVLSMHLSRNALGRRSVEVLAERDPRRVDHDGGERDPRRGGM